LQGLERHTEQQEGAQAGTEDRESDREYQASAVVVIYPNCNAGVCLRIALWESHAPAFPAKVSATAVFNFHGPLRWLMRAALATFVQGTPFGTSAKVWNCFAEGSG